MKLKKHSEDWNLKEYHIKKAISLTKADGALSKVLGDTRRLFLYAKGILDYETSDMLLESPLKEFEDVRARLG